MVLHENKDCRWYSFPSFDALPGVVTFVTTRNGVVHGDVYSTDNMGEYTGDNPDRVIANRQRICRSLGIDTLISPRQIHGTKVLSVTDEFIRLSKPEQTACLDGVDAVMTDCPSVAIAVSTADCVPVLLYDAVHRACAAVHAGWRGMAGHIVRRSIDEMVNMYGTVPSDLYVAVGPSIGPDNFEVGDEVVQTFDSEGFDVNRIAHRYPSGRFHIDLWAAAVEELTACGVDLSRIEVAGICTRAHDWEFFSARSLGFHSGRFLTDMGNDALKMMSFDPRIPQIYVYNEKGVRFAHTQTADIEGETPVGIYTGESGIYEISLTEDSEYDRYDVVVLIDRSTGRKVDLKHAPYSFTVDDRAMETGRFSLSFKTLSDEMQQPTFYSPGKRQLRIVNLQGGESIGIYDTLGRQRASRKAYGESEEFELESGVYMIRIEGSSLVKGKVVVK